MTEATAAPSILDEIEADESAFLESIGAELPEGDNLTDVDARIDWLMEQIVERQEQVEHVEDVAERRMDMIREWRDRETAKVRREIEWLEGQIRKNVPQTVDRLQEVYGTRKKSVSLPNGSFGFRSKRDTVEIEDEDAALQWAEDHRPDAVKIKRSVLKTPLIEYVEKTGLSEGPGWRFVPGSDEFYVNVGG